MNIKDNRQNAHNEIDHIFNDLLPAQGMGKRPAQIALSHQMLDAMLDKSIARKDLRLSGGRGGVPPLPGRPGRGVSASPHLHFQHCPSGCGDE